VTFAEFLQFDRKKQSAAPRAARQIEPIMILRFILSLAALLSVTSASAREALEEAWWTGPLLAAGAGTLPEGHVLFEPYLYDVMGAHSNSWRSRTYLLYGVTDRFTFGAIPIFGYNRVSGGPSSSSLEVSDLTLQAQYRLASWREGSWVPTVSAVLKESLPTGRYDRLGSHPNDGLGDGSYATTGALYTQSYFWLPDERILRMRFNIEATFSSAAALHGVSVYGTPEGFDGHVRPGDNLYFNAAWEYSITQRWVLAFDATYSTSADTKLVGGNLVADLGPSRNFAFAPALEYNWSPAIGVIAGFRAIPAGRNTPGSITPAVALNVVY
jgi:hypothetical protein